MKPLRTLLSIIILTGAAFAWPSCNGTWNQVPSGSGPGFYTTGDHLTFQCQTPNPTPKDPTTSNSTASSTSAANSNSTSNSASNSTATSITSQSQKQQQTQTANGGSASSNASNGDQANSQSSTYVNNQVRQAPMAYAPEAFSTASCRVAGSLGASAPFGGLALGGSKKDRDCEKIAISNGFFTRGNAVAGCKLLLSVKSLKGLLTMDECLVTVIPPPPVITQVAPAPLTPTSYIATQPVPPVVMTEKPQVINVVAP